MALDTRGLASGVAQGFGLMDNYYRGQKQDDRAERGLQMREESFGMQKEQYQQSQKEKQATVVYGKMMQQVPLGDEDMQFLKDNPNYLQALNPEMDQSIEIAQRVIDPEDELDLNSEEGLYAMNTMFSHRINRGEGGKKRIAGGYPGQREGTLALDLEVEREDGTKYSAPRTRNAGVEGDDEVLQTDIGDVVNQVQGYRAIRNVINQSGSSEYAAKMYSLLTGKERETQETWSEPFEYQGGRYQRSETTGELREVQSPDDVRKGSGVSAELSPQQEVYAKRLQSEVDHLWRMERQIQTGQSDGMSIFLGGMEEQVTPENKDALLSDIRTRIQANEQELNKMLGVSVPQQGYETLIQEAEKIPPAQREQELSELKNNPRVPYMVIRQIEKMWGMDGGPQPQPQDSPQEQPQQTGITPPANEQQPAAPAPDPIQQPQSQREPESQRGLQPAVAERSGPQPEQRGLQNPNEGVPFMEQRLGPMIESAGRSVVDAQSNYRDDRLNSLARQLAQSARGQSDNRYLDVKEVISRNPQVLKRMSPDDLAKLKQQHGAQFINQFLQQ